MGKQYYYMNGGVQAGPISLEMLMRVVSPDTLVWYDGISEWTPARLLPELSPMFTQQRITAAYAAPQQNQMPTQPNTTGLLIWSIIMTVFCCAIHGALGIIYAVKSKNAWQEGRYNDAVSDFHKGKNWIVIGSIVVFVIYVIIYAIYGFAWLVSMGY